jgi:hypothetical protein
MGVTAPRRTLPVSMLGVVKEPRLGLPSPVGAKWWSVTGSMFPYRERDWQFICRYTPALKVIVQHNKGGGAGVGCAPERSGQHGGLGGMGMAGRCSMRRYVAGSPAALFSDTKSPVV